MGSGVPSSRLRLPSSRHVHTAAYDVTPAPSGTGSLAETDMPLRARAGR